MIKYFQGDSLTGPVYASDAQTFADVVAILGHAPRLGIKRAAFFALPEEKRNELKQVKFFVPGCFTKSPSPRQVAHVTHCNLVMLDLDEDKATGHCSAAPFVAHPESLRVALAGFNFFAHTTASSTPEKPRMRVIVEADEIPVADYARAVRTVGEMLALGKVTKESKITCQPMYKPSIFMDDPPSFHPQLDHFLDGRAFTVQDISENLADEYSKPHALSSTPDDLDFLRAQVPEVTLAIARDALTKINPDLDRAAWLEVAASLRHQFSPKEAEEAYQLFDEWSATGTKYQGEEDTQKMWDSLRPTPNGRPPRTIRSLLKLAVVGGWDDTRIRKTSVDLLIEWIEAQDSFTTLVERGIEKILALPLVSSIQEGSLIDRIKLQAKNRFGEKVLTSAIKEDMERVRKKIRALDSKDEKVKMPFWAKGVCYVAATQQFFRQRTGEKYTLPAFNSTYAEHLTPQEDNELARPTALPSDYVLNILRIPKVFDFSYDPSKPTEVFFTHRERQYVNIYSPTYPELEPEKAEWAGALFQTHLGNLVKEPAYRQTLVDFLAYMVQFPGRKIRWALFIQSAEGAGKTFLAKVMRVVLGNEHVRVISGESINKGWNEWSFGRQLVVLEEVRAVGSSRHTVMTALKQLVTNDDIPIDQRNRDTREVENITNYMLFSNFHDGLALTSGNRRYCVLKSPLQMKSQVLALGEGYFAKLFNMLRDHPGAMRSFLNDWEISPGFDPDGHAPQTIYAAEMVEDSANDLHAAVRRMLKDGDHPLVQYDIVSSTHLIELLTLEPGLGRVSAQQVGQILREEGFKNEGRHMLAGAERPTLWVRQGGSMNGSFALIAAERLAKNSKNLCMELDFS